MSTMRHPFGLNMLGFANLIPRFSFIFFALLTAKKEQLLIFTN